MFTTFDNFEQAFRSTSLSIVQLLYLLLYNYQGQKIMDVSWNVCGRVWVTYFLYNIYIIDNICNMYAYVEKISANKIHLKKLSFNAKLSTWFYPRVTFLICHAITRVSCKTIPHILQRYIYRNIICICISKILWDFRRFNKNVRSNFLIYHFNKSGEYWYILYSFRY